MKIVNVEDLHADGGYRTCSYVKVTTDEGLVGWSEYYDFFTGSRLPDIIRSFASTVIGMNPCEPGRISTTLHATTRLAAGGLNHQAIAAIENACLDIQGKAYGVPVYALFGGPFRDRIDCYWTHCGSYRVLYADFYEKECQTPPVRTLDDFKRLGQEAVARGFKAIKTNPVSFAGPRPRFFNGGFHIAPGFLDRNIDNRYIGEIIEQLSAFRDGIGPDSGLMLDVSFNQRTEGYLRIAKAVEHLNLTWLELDIPDAESLGFIRRSTATPIASLESLYRLSEFRPFFQNHAVDVAIIDAIWVGVWQSVRLATLADAFEVNIAPHNPVGDLATLISAHFAASVPNFRMMELRVDEAPWIKDYLTHPPAVENGQLILPARPGWGSDINEDALRAHPPRNQRLRAEVALLSASPFW